MNVINILTWNWNMAMKGKIIMCFDCKNSNDEHLKIQDVNHNC